MLILLQKLILDPSRLSDNRLNMNLMELLLMIFMTGFTWTCPKITMSLEKLVTASTVEHSGFNTRGLRFVAGRGKWIYLLLRFLKSWYSCLQVKLTRMLNILEIIFDISTPTFHSQVLESSLIIDDDLFQFLLKLVRISLKKIQMRRIIGAREPMRLFDKEPIYFKYLFKNIKTFG